jgi:hypothetical protein
LNNLQPPWPLARARTWPLIAPKRDILPSQWAAINLTVPDGPYAGKHFDLELTPYLIEPLDFFCDACPENKAAIRKSAQSGFYAGQQAFAVIREAIRKKGVVAV